MVTINRKGFRGPEVSYARENAGKRVLVLGDSLVWGFGVNFGDMFTTQMEKLLPNTQVVNLGVSGYSTDQELLLYQDEGRKYRADIVVIVVAANDRAGNERNVENLIYGKPRFIVRNGNLELTNNPVEETSWMKRAAVWLTWRSFVLSQLHRTIYQAGATGAMAPEKIRERENSEITDSSGVNHKRTAPLAAWEITLRLLMEMKRTIEKDGAELLVVLSDGIGMSAASEIGAFLKSSQINGIFLDEYLGANDPSLHLPDQVHWSPAGNKIVASVVAEKLRRENVWVFDRKAEGRAKIRRLSRGLLVSDNYYLEPSF